MNNTSWMAPDLDVTFGVCDHLNPGHGYFIRITRSDNGQKVLHTSQHPVTGKDLDFAGCLEVAAMYGRTT